MGLMIGWPCSQHSDNILIIEKPKVITPTNGLRSVSIDRDPVPLQAQPVPMKPPIIDSLFLSLSLSGLSFSLACSLLLCVSLQAIGCVERWDKSQTKLVGFIAF